MYMRLSNDSTMLGGLYHSNGCTVVRLGGLCSFVFYGDVFGMKLILLMYSMGGIRGVLRTKTTRPFVSLCSIAILGVVLSLGARFISLKNCNGFAVEEQPLRIFIVRQLKCVIFSITFERDCEIIVVK